MAQSENDAVEAVAKALEDSLQKLRNLSEEILSGKPLKKEYKGRWLVIEWYGDPALVFNPAHAPNEWRWNGGPSYMVEDEENLKILGVCPISRFKDSAGNIDEEARDLWFYRAYPPVAGHNDKARCSGWLAPDGKFYQCGYTEHRAMAECLSAVYYNNLDGERELEAQGWLKVAEDGQMGWMPREMRFDDRITQAQLDTLFDMHRSLNSGDEKEHTLRWMDRIGHYLRPNGDEHDKYNLAR